MLLRLITFLGLLSIIIFASCGTTTYNLVHYVPVEPNLMKISSKGVLKISGSIKTTNENRDRDKYRHFQIGYSPRQNIGLFYGHSFFRNSSRNSTFYLNSLSIGWYKFMKTEDRWRIRNFNGHDKGWLYELYGGVGYGKMESITFISGIYPPMVLDNSKLNIAQIYIRGGLHWQSEIMGFSLSMTTGGIDYFGGEINLGTQNNSLLYQEFFKKAIDNGRGFFIAPSSKVSFGSKDLSLYIGGTYHKLFSASDFETKQNIIYIGLNSNILELSQYFKRRKKRKEEREKRNK